MSNRSKSKIDFPPSPSFLGSASLLILLPPLPKQHMGTENGAVVRPSTFSLIHCAEITRVTTLRSSYRKHTCFLKIHCYRLP